MTEFRLGQRRADRGQGLHGHVLPESPQGTRGIGRQAAEDLGVEGRTREPIKIREIRSLGCRGWTPGLDPWVTESLIKHVPQTLPSL